MPRSHIQVYSHKDIIKRYENVLTDKRLAVLDIGPKYKQYFIVNKPYQFNTFGLILVTAGQCEITINLEPRVIKKDDLLVVLSNQFFEIKEFSKEFAVKTTFIDSDLFLEAGFHLKADTLVQFLSSEYPKVISLDRACLREVNYHLHKLKKLGYLSDNLFAKNLVLHHFSILMYEIGNFYGKSILERNKPKPIRKEEITKQFIYLVATHFKKERSVQFYADQLYISRKHLTKVIVEVLNKTPKQFISDTIILEAKVLLRNPKTTITEIVSELNFTDVAMFSKFFKTHTKIAPSKFKNLS
ncbi:MULTISPECIES: helix-turn-helix domain-containing protein [Myroides]|uniref:Helix-turn-helix domain-containing protein n=1 Tax=Myroides albus TaxID=2562892 RepID=A0A6I3LFG2_9FLAO|nr:MULTISPECIES: helix-turn-helix domain-containing protein [Myroides]MTG96903.1 helix-turn-helix domain-containing protein [Myroides albus]MVX35593.1 helix-turn-helix domain-containing protein [Myroides sp. LoEW2-1]UVD78347.1 helix-turn-helix domain-containing protein [Myroides albus]